jgi:DNA-binding NarL/FixJ family response regulator
MTHHVDLSGARHLLIRLPVAAVPLALLTPAEQAVVEGALAGRSNAELALSRSTSTRTIANQLSAAYQKLGVRSRSELARKLSAPSGLPNAAVLELLTGGWILTERVDALGRRWAIARPRPTPLTTAELDALRARALGASLAKIAAALGVSEPTASRRVKSGMQKLGVGSVAELARVLAECA